MPVRSSDGTWFVLVATPDKVPGVLKALGREDILTDPRFSDPAKLAQNRPQLTRKSIWQQHLGPVKTEESEKLMPLDEEMVADLERWRQETPYAQDSDWIFASPRMHGRQPLWPEALMRNYIVSAAARAGITKHINWHVFRHTFSTPLAANGEDVKTVQSLLRHANPSITLSIYTRAVSSKKREAQSRVVEMVLPRDRRAMVVAGGGSA
jgi:integrase